MIFDVNSCLGDCKYLSNHLNQVYTEHEGRRPHAVHTSWAMLALIDAGQVCFVFVICDKICTFTIYAT